MKLTTRLMLAADMAYGCSLIALGLAVMGVGALMPHL